MVSLRSGLALSSLLTGSGFLSRGGVSSFRRFPTTAARPFSRHFRYCLQWVHIVHVIVRVLCVYSKNISYYAKSFLHMFHFCFVNSFINVIITSLSLFVTTPCHHHYCYNFNHFSWMVQWKSSIWHPSSPFRLQLSQHIYNHRWWIRIPGLSLVFPQQRQTHLSLARYSPQEWWILQHDYRNS